MTTWYVDYEGGTNANASAGNGDSFATRRKTIDNCVAAAIAPGDTIRIMGSPAPTSVGNATWTDGPLPATVSISGSTNTTPITVSFSLSNWTTLAAAVGDTVIVNGHTTNTNANGVWKVSAIDSVNYKATLVNADGSNSVGNGVGSGGSIRKFTNAVVTLASAATQNIALCGNGKTNWTASANVTTSIVTTDYKEGYGCQQLAIAAGFTTGLAAYFPVTSLNLSGYQQVSFWVKQTAGTIGAAGAARLRLCTDALGVVPVHDLPIPALGALNQWVPAVVNLGANLNAAILSVSFDVVTDNGAQTFLIDNIIACKASSSADSLNLTSLISKDPGGHSYGDGYEGWWGIQSINGTRVVLDGTVNSIPGSAPQRGYSGTTETVTTYKRETIKTVVNGTSTGIVQDIKDSGTAGNLITFSGGWNRTDMSTQTLETWFDGQNGFGYGISSSGVVSFDSIDKIHGTRYQSAISFGSSINDQTIGRHEACNCSGAPVLYSGSRLTATTLSAVACGGAITPGSAAVVTTIGRADSTTSGGGLTQGAGSQITTIKSASNNTLSGAGSGVVGYIGEITKANGNGANGYVTANYSVCGSVTANNNTTAGISVAATVGSLILGGSTSGNASGGVTVTTGRGTLRNFTINESTEVSGHTAYNDGRVHSEKHDGTANYSVIFCDGGLIATDTGVVHGSATRSWKFSPTSANRSQYYPLNQSIAQVAVAANALVTVKAWMRRDNTGLTARLICKGKQLSGVASDVYADMTVAANTWEELTITFTPTEAGVIEIEAQFWGGTSYNGWVSGMTITQA